MLTYMPGAHRLLVTHFRGGLARCGTLRAYCKARNSAQATAAFDEAVAAMEALRQFHLGIATKYLARTSKVGVVLRMWGRALVWLGVRCMPGYVPGLHAAIFPSSQPEPNPL